MGSHVSTIPQKDFRTSWKAARTDVASTREKAFSTMLQESIREGVRAALGQAVLGILTEQGLFDKASEPSEFHRKLQTVFGNGAAVIEKIIIKDLFHKMSLPFTFHEPFCYGEDLERARAACSVEVPTR